MKFKCVIFDLDGTLIDSLQGILDACNDTFDQLGLNIHKGIEEAKYFIGAGATVFAKRAMEGKLIPPGKEQEIMDLFLKNYERTQVISAKPFPGIIDFLTKLKAKGYKLCIASNKPQKLLKPIVKQLFGDDLFDIAYGQFPNAPEKPDPYIVNKIIDTLNVNKADCVYVGDSEYDVETAINSGLESIIVKYGYGFYDKPWIKKATYTVDSVNELNELLN